MQNTDERCEDGGRKGKIGKGVSCMLRIHEGAKRERRKASRRDAKKEVR